MNPACLSDDRLAAYEAGEGGAEERAAVAAHLRECERCRQELAWLVELRGRLEKLPRQVAPARDLWQGIAPRLETTIVSLPQHRRFRPMMLAAAAVFLVLAVSAAALLLIRRNAAPGSQVASDSAGLPSAPAGLPAPGSAAALAQLASEVQALERALPPETRALVAHNLELIDAAIRESRAALTANPSNPAIGRMLEARYGQRLLLLQQARRAAPES
jgi:anti-sigma factor RsiW